jgi:hypothetical protein
LHPVGFQAGTEKFSVVLSKLKSVFPLVVSGHFQGTINKDMTKDLAETGVEKCS